MQSPRPRSFERIGEEFLAVAWEDGHESFFDGPFLRARCPCAECRVKRENAPAPQQSSPSLSLLAFAPPRLVGAEEVGRYALRLYWSDGHATGLFEYRLLRSLCRCEACAAERPPPDGDESPPAR